jgi:opacity protein-like surface antigen
MRKTLAWLAVVAVVMMLGPGTASAQNWYAHIRGGPNFPEDTKQGPPGGQEVFELGTGFAASAAVGHQFPFGLRLEGEIGYLYSPVKTDGGVDVDGSIKSFTGMFNAYFAPKFGSFRPFLGGGVGAARVNDDHEWFSERLLTKFEASPWRTAFAYQVRAGLIYDVNQWLDLSLSYRYLHIDGGHYDVGPEGAKFRVDVGGMNNHAVELGFAVKF